MLRALKLSVDRSSTACFSLKCMVCLMLKKSMWPNPQHIQPLKRCCLSHCLFLPCFISSRLSLFTEFPLVTLYEGIFTKQNHAESYLVTYTPRDEIPDAHYFEDASAIRGISMLALSSSAFGTVLSFLSAASNPNLNQRGKVKIDGFKIGDNTGHGPQSWQVKTPIM